MSSHIFYFWLRAIYAAVIQIIPFTEWGTSDYILYALFTESTVRLSLERTQVSSFISCMYCIHYICYKYSNFSCFTSASPSMEYTNWICLSRNSSVSHVTSTHSSFPIINVLSPHLFLDTAEGVEMIEHSPCDLI